MIPFNNLKADYSYHKEAIDNSVQDVLASGWHILGKEVSKFETQLAKFSQVKYSVGVASGLDSLELSLQALGIGKGDHVITTPVSAFATTLAILNTGAVPVFVDIDPQTGMITPQSIEVAITAQTKAVLPVNLYGQLANVKKISQICKKHRLYFIEDSAQAIGTQFKGTKTGQYSDAACLSFYPTKNLGAYGDGGAVLTNNPEIAQKVKILRHYGQTSTYNHTHLGRNSRLDELQAAILNAKLLKLTRIIKKRQHIASWYTNKIKNPKIKLLRNQTGHTYHLFVVKTDQRTDLQNYLKVHKIESLIHYPTPLYRQPVMDKIAHINKCTSQVSDEFCDQVLSLPIHPYLTRQQVNYIIKVLNNW
jgi:dTDP-4-amino-4,6-dideoxygalactose transaminase